MGEGDQAAAAVEEVVSPSSGGSSSVAQVAASESPTRRRRAGWTSYGVALVTLGLFVLFSITNASTFFTVANVQIIAGSNSIALLAALAALAPLVAGEFDLSVGSVLEASSVLVAVAVGEKGWNPLLGIAAATVLGCLIGLLNGILVTKVRISSFIATLGVGSVVSALSLYLTHGQILFQGIPVSLRNFSQNNVVGVPIIAIVALAFAVVGWVVLEKTVYGRRLLATGLARQASELMGIKTKRMVLSSFVISGGIAATAGWIQLGHVGSASTGISATFLLPALTAGFLGATTIKVGRFNVAGTVLAVALVAIGVSGLELNGAPNWVIPLFDGAVLLAAVGVSRLSAKGRAAR